MELGGYSNSLTVTANNGVSQVSDDPNTTEDDDPTVVNFDIVKELEVIKTSVVIDYDSNTFNSVNDTINYSIEVKNTGTVPLYGLTLTDSLTTRGTFDPADPTLEFQNKSVPAAESLASIWAYWRDEPNNASTSSEYAAQFWSGDGGLYLDDYEVGANNNSNKKYVAESDDPTLTSISGYTHLGVYNGHSYFSRNIVDYWYDQATAAANNSNSIYMLLIDSVDEFEAVRDMLFDKGLNEDHWIGLLQKKNKTQKNGWFWIGKDNDPGAVNAYDPANHEGTVSASSETADNYPFYFEDHFELDSTNDGTLNPGEIANFTASYVIEQDAVTSGGGFIDNTVLAKAKSTASQDDFDVEDRSDGDTEQVDGDDDGDFENDPTVISLPNFKVTKTSDINDDNGESGTNAGDTITYTIEVTNTGGETLSNISFEDTFVDADGNVLYYDPSNISPKTGAVFDHQGNSYEYVTFNSSVHNVALQYMTSNYGPTTYTDGTTIPEVVDPDQWKQ
jgi:uncharacterized repeat protein (TIGR01451 family)